MTEETVDLPSKFLDWLSRSRGRLFDEMLGVGAGAIKSQPSHLAVMATIDPESGRINLATKGWGPLPDRQHLLHMTRTFESSGRSDGLRDRIAVARTFYSNPGLFDHAILGGLEIFEGKSHHNLLNDPHASLLFTGEPPDYPSYQLDGFISVIRPPDPRYEFLLQARLLFGGDPFHVPQKEYPWGYLFSPTRVTVKTPFSRR